MPIKRVILSAEGDGGTFKDVDLTWTSLVKKLQKIAKSDHVVAEPLSECPRPGRSLSKT